jgi:hypothetical protein
MVHAAPSDRHDPVGETPVASMEPDPAPGFITPVNT